MGAPAYCAVLLFALALAVGAAADSAPQEPTLPSTPGPPARGSAPTRCRWRCWTRTTRSCRSSSWPRALSGSTLSGEDLELAAGANGSLRVSHAAVTRPDAVLRPDGVIHGIERLLVPRSVQEDFNRRRSLAAISAVLPTGAPEVDPRTHCLKKPAPPVLHGAPPVLPV